LLDTSVDSKTSLRLRKVDSYSYSKTTKSNKKMPSATSKKLESTFKVASGPNRFDYMMSSPVRQAKKPKQFETVQKDRANIDDDDEHSALLQTTYKITKAARKRASVSKSHKKTMQGK
jgi:hypothetical protein